MMNTIKIIFKAFGGSLKRFFISVVDADVKVSKLDKVRTGMILIPVILIVLGVLFQAPNKGDVVDEMTYFNGTQEVYQVYNGKDWVEMTQSEYESVYMGD